MYTRLTTCDECADIMSLIDDIDCKLAKLAGRMYNNMTLMLDFPIPEEVVIDLINYKRILQKKYSNPTYLSNYTINMIASKVKLLIYKQ
jgi:hypothetical protein